jgi:hypothetical protein
MAEFLPVLLGSRAAGTNHDRSDYDVIAFKEMPFYRRVIDSNDPTPKIDLFDRSFDKELLVYLNNIRPPLPTVELFGHQIIVPPKDVLAMIYLTSIFRVVPYTKDPEINEQIWLKRVKTYNALRSQIDYKKFDFDIYQNQGGILYQQFHARFDHKIKQFGDAIVTLEEDSKAFFKDNVKRKFDHDYLHTTVAQMNRGTSALLFEKFQNSDNVGLDEHLFNQGDTSEKVQMVQEEMIVLMLERKIIPALELNGKYHLDQFNADFNSISSHFATNLCGQRHHFLRKWVLDHFFIITDNTSISMEDIVKKAYELCNITKNENIDPSTYEQLPPESIRLYERLSKILGVSELKGYPESNDHTVLHLTGPRTGYGIDLDHREFVLEISMVDSVCIFRQVYLDSEDCRTDQKQVVVCEQEVHTQRNKRIRIEKVYQQAEYCSVIECGNSTCDHDHSDNEKEERVESEDENTDYRYYLNSYGYINRFKLCKDIARTLIKDSLPADDSRRKIL